jgi:hypothetical protein
MVDGGAAMRCAAREWSNFVRVDDLGNEIKITVIDQNEQKPTKNDLLDQLRAQMTYLENLPAQALSASASNYDLFALMALLLAIFNSDFKEEI